jgi:hypothetical protein
MCENEVKKQAGIRGWQSESGGRVRFKALVDCASAGRRRNSTTSTHQVGLIDRIHSILSVETMRTAAIILNELLIFGDWAFGH